MRRVLVLVIVFAGCVGDNASNSLLAGTHDSLVRVDPEPAGTNCTAGGVAIHTGSDANDDGSLEDSEIASTQYVCNGSTAVRCDSAGTTHTGSVTISSFVDFAQLAGVSCIDGDLLISTLDESTLPSLDPRIVTGSVVVAANDHLTSLAGLSLQQIGTTFLIQGNSALTDLSALTSLTHIGSIQIVNNNGLIDLVGLLPFTQLANLLISSNASLTSLHGLENVQAFNSLVVKSNSALTSVDGLEQVRKGTVWEISGNSSLQDISIPALEKLDERLLINTNVELTSIDLPMLVSVAGTFQFDADPVLTSITAPHLLLTGSLQFQDVPSLDTVTMPKLNFATESVLFINVQKLVAPELTSLSEIGADLNVDTTNIELFTGLTALESVGGNMTVNHNNALTGFSGLSSFTHVGGNLKITSNGVLSSLNAQSFASSLTIAGSITIN